MKPAAPSVALFLSGVCLFMSLCPVWAQVVLSGGSYAETFDGLGAGLPSGWSVVTGASSTALGTAANFPTAAVSWGNSTGAFGNYAAATNDGGSAFAGSESVAVQAACANRCLGVRQSASFGDPGAAFLVQFQDTLGYGDFELSLDLNQLSAQARSTVWSIQYALGNAPNTFVTVDTFSDPGAFGTTRQTCSFGHALDNQSQPVWIRVAALTPSSGSGSRDTFGLDNFVLTFAPYHDSTEPPVIVLQPTGRTNNAATQTSFHVIATGAAPSHYQWRKNGADLYDGGNVLGATSATLTLTNLLGADAAVYSVIVSNAYGVVISSNASLIVIDPVMTLPPISRTNLVGDTAGFSCAAAGTPALAYQWRLDGKELADATTSTLILENIQANQQGAYTVVVSNAYGAITSTVAILKVPTTPSVRLAGWDFNAFDTSTNAPLPSFGTGTAALVGEVRGALSTGSPADAAGAGNRGWSTSGYPSASTNNKTAGVQFNVSTGGHQNLLLTWEERHSDTASKYLRLQYSTNGMQFSDGPVIVMQATNNSYVFFSADLSAFPGVNDNPNFAFRLVTEWESTAIGSTRSNYVATTSTYGGGGTIRLDLVNVFGSPLGTVVPIPLQVRRLGNQVVLSWSDPAFSLQSGPAADAAFTTIPGATSPHTNAFSGARRFFRLKYGP